MHPAFARRRPRHLFDPRPLRARRPHRRLPSRRDGFHTSTGSARLYTLQAATATTDRIAVQATLNGEALPIVTYDQATSTPPDRHLPPPIRLSSFRSTTPLSTSAAEWSPHTHQHASSESFFSLQLPQPQTLTRSLLRALLTAATPAPLLPPPPAPSPILRLHALHHRHPQRHLRPPPWPAFDRHLRRRPHIAPAFAPAHCFIPIPVPGRTISPAATRPTGRLRTHPHPVVLHLHQQLAFHRASGSAASPFPPSIRGSSPCLIEFSISGCSSIARHHHLQRVVRRNLLHHPQLLAKPHLLDIQVIVRKRQLFLKVARTPPDPSAAPAEYLPASRSSPAPAPASNAPAT